MSAARQSETERPSALGVGWKALTLVVLAVATCAAFAGVLRADWILFDDPVYAVRNPHIMNGFTLEGLRWILTHPHGGNFHPLTSMSHMLDCELFGVDPRGPHAINLALHVANALLVCVVLARYTGAWWRSALVAAFFALHPVHVESVAWISERKDVLSTLFFLLALGAYRRWTLSPSLARHSLLVLCFVLGLLAKPMLVTLPFILLLLDAWPLGRAHWPLVGRGAWPLWREKWVLFVIAGFSAITTYFVQHAAGAVMTSQLMGPVARIENALASYARYLGMMFWPHDLAIYYPLTGVVPVGLAIVGATIIAVSTAYFWKRRSEHGAGLTGWLWFVGTLIPVIGIVQVGAQAAADRYTYIPSIGLGLAVVWTAAELVRARAVRTALTAGAVLLLAVCAVATTRQVALWKDTRTLFTHAIEVTTSNAVALQNLGNALLIDGEIQPAITRLEEALRLIPDFPDAHNNLGTAYGNEGRLAEAIAQFRAALLTQDTAETHQNLGWALTKSGRADEAIAEYEASLRLDPDFAASHAKLGAIFAARGRLDEASAHLERALALDSNDVETHRSLAITRVYQGRIEEGIAAYREVLKRAPGDLDALNNIAWIRATHIDPAHRNGAEAVQLSETARDAPHDPNHVLFSTLAAAYAEVGRFDDAIHAGERAIELALAAGDADAARRFEAQLAHYRAREPVHQ